MGGGLRTVGSYAAAPVYAELVALLVGEATKGCWLYTVTAITVEKKVKLLKRKERTTIVMTCDDDWFAYFLYTIKSKGLEKWVDRHKQVCTKVCLVGSNRSSRDTNIVMGIHKDHESIAT